ncbi:STAS domain-containing protein [Streptomyces sp. NPDC059215]|uniref:STAS domain-containing protein n=1 Tax=Streptomyces sp. NPDC059215 TaxID=3346772 RepID=UPI0036C10260
MADMHDTAEQPVRLSISQTTCSGIRVLALSGEIDADNVDRLRQSLTVGRGDLAHTVLDLSGVTFIDSSVISVLASAHRDATASHGWIRMAALGMSVQRVVGLVGLDAVIGCYPTLAQALVA